MSTTRPCELDRILQEQLQILAATLKPSTIKYYRTQANGFLRYLHRDYPETSLPRPTATQSTHSWLASKSRLKTTHRSPTDPAVPPSSVCAGSLTIWPTTDIPSGKRSFSARTSRLTTCICQYLFLLKSTTSWTANYAKPMISSPMPSS